MSRRSRCSRAGGDPALGRRRKDEQEFKAVPCNIVSFRPAWATYDSASEKQKPTQSED